MPSTEAPRFLPFHHFNLPSVGSWSKPEVAWVTRDEQQRWMNKNFKTSEHDYLWKLIYWSATALHRNYEERFISRAEYDRQQYAFCDLHEWDPTFGCKKRSLRRDPMTFVPATHSVFEGPKLDSVWKRSRIATWLVCAGIDIQHTSANVVCGHFPWIVQHLDTFPEARFRILDYQKSARSEEATEKDATQQAEQTRCGPEIRQDESNHANAAVKKKENNANSGSVASSSNEHHTTQPSPETKVASAVQQYNVDMAQVTQLDKDIESLVKEVETQTEKVRVQSRILEESKKKVESKRKARTEREREARDSLCAKIASDPIVPAKRSADTMGSRVQVGHSSWDKGDLGFLSQGSATRSAWRKTPSWSGLMFPERVPDEASEGA